MFSFGNVVMNGQVNSYEISFNPPTGEITCQGSSSVLNRFAAACLLLLLEKRGETVDKDAILSHCWNQQGIFVSDTSVRQVIAKIRKALKSLGIEEEIIRTVARRGYRIDSDAIKISGVVSASDVISLAEGEKIPRSYKYLFRCFTLRINRLILLFVFSLFISTLAFFWRVDHIISPVDYRLFYKKDDMSYYVQTDYSPGVQDVYEVETLRKDHPNLFNNVEYVYINYTAFDRSVSAFLCRYKVEEVKSNCVSLFIMRGDHA